MALIDFGFGVEGVDRFLEGEAAGVVVGVEMGVQPAEYVLLILVTTTVVVVMVSSLVTSPKSKGQ